MHRFFLGLIMDNEFFVEFILKAEIRGLGFNSESLGEINFKPNNESNFRIVLEHVDENDNNNFFTKLICKAYNRYSVTKEEFDFIKNYSRERKVTRISKEYTIPFKPNTKVLIGEDGACLEGFSLRRYLCPEDIVSLIDIAEKELSSKIERFLALIRWRQGVTLPAEAAENRILYWRDGESKDYYFGVPLDIEPPGEKTLTNYSLNMSWSKEDEAILEDMWQEDGLYEPLGHTLLREAQAVVKESPRSAIMIMAAAVETAVKMHISKIEPNTSWLMEKIPAPPIYMILRDYLPLLHPEVTYFDKIKPLFKDIERLFMVRNKVAHTGVIPEKLDKFQVPPVASYLKLVSDILYFLDVLGGHEWAKKLANYSLQEKVGWPKLVNYKATVYTSYP